MRPENAHGARLRPTSPGTCTMVPWSPGIYRIVCVATGEVYIGHSLKLGKRWMYHQQNLFGGKHGNPKLQRAFNKHGPDQFYFEVLEVLPANKDLLIRREQWWLDHTELKFNIIPANGRRPSGHRPMWKHAQQRFRDRRSGNNGSSDK